LTGINCYIDKIADGVYKVTNPGGAGAGVNTIVYFVETEPNVYVCPEQPTDAGTMSVENIAFTATGSTWNVNNAGYGSQQRIFTKQCVSGFLTYSHCPFPEIARAVIVFSHVLISQVVF
jgi:hypothetical protein